MGDEYSDLYIGVTQQRKSFVGSETSKLGTTLTFYEVLGGDKEYFVVDGIGINPGDSFLFYHSDPDTASSSCSNVYENLEVLKAENEKRGTICHRGRCVTGNNYKKEVLGGLIFSCYYRGESFFRRPNVDTLPFCKNFPGVPLAGVFCSGEIGRSSTSLIKKEEDQEENTPRCYLHVYSTVYLVMSYVPASPVLEYC